MSNATEGNRQTCGTEWSDNGRYIKGNCLMSNSWVIQESMISLTAIVLSLDLAHRNFWEATIRLLLSFLAPWIDCISRSPIGTPSYFLIQRSSYRSIGTNLSVLRKIMLGLILRWQMCIPLLFFKNKSFSPSLYLLLTCTYMSLNLWHIEWYANSVDKADAASFWSFVDVGILLAVCKLPIRQDIGVERKNAESNGH